MNLAVSTRLQYLVPSGEKPVYFASTGGADAQLKVSAEFEEHTVTVHDARQLPAPARLDHHGFALVHQATAVEDFYSEPGAWQARYEKELEALILSATGASDIHIFDHTLRSDSSSVRGDRDSREPATVIHNDYTDASARKRLEDLLPQQQAQRWLSGRFAIVNAWRSVAGPVITTPLACCDASTIAPVDLVASERRARDRTGELELVSWNPAHRWYYYPEMQRDEVLLIKTFDSAQDGRATRSVHTAFLNPLAGKDAPPRESIESRSIVFFG